MNPNELNDAFRQEGILQAARLTRDRESGHNWPATLRFLRRLFIGLVIAVFLFYCWASVAYQNQVDVPDYHLVHIDLLGGKTRAQWDADEGSQFQQLMALENKRYQLPAGKTLTIKGKDGKETVLNSDQSLTSEDFAAVIAQTPAGSAVTMDLRDPTAIYALAGDGYLLRDSIYDPNNPEGAPLIQFDEPVTKDLVDRLHRLGVKVITITGHGTAVGFDPGTAIMVALIFLGLVAALKPILWDPFQALLDKRQKELEIGAEVARNNQSEAAKLAEERARRNAQLVRDIQAKRMQRQQQTAREAEAILNKAHSEEKTARHRDLQEINLAAGEADQALGAQVPELAEAIVKTILERGGEKGGR